ETVAPVRRIPGGRGAAGESQAAVQGERQARSISSRPLPSEGTGDHAGRRCRASARSRAIGEGDRVQLLRHGGVLLGWNKSLRSFHAGGGGESVAPAAEAAQRVG